MEELNLSLPELVLSLFFFRTEYDKGSDCNVCSFCVCYHGVHPGAATPGELSISDAAFCLSTRFLGRVDELFSCSRSDFYCRFQWFSKITLMMKNSRSAVKIAALLVKASKKASSNCMTLYFLSSRTDRGSIVLRKTLTIVIVAQVRIQFNMSFQQNLTINFSTFFFYFCWFFSELMI